MAFLLVPLGIEIIEAGIGIGEGIVTFTEVASTLGEIGVVGTGIGATEAVGAGLGATEAIGAGLGATEAIGAGLGATEAIGAGIGAIEAIEAGVGLGEIAGSLATEEGVVGALGVGTTDIELEAGITGLTNILEDSEITATEALDILPSSEVAVSNEILDSSIESDLIMEENAALSEDIFGSGGQIVLDDTPDIINPGVIDLTKVGIMTQIENVLADAGITIESLGSANYNKIIGAIAAGSLTVDEVIKLINDTNIEDSIGAQIDNLVKNKNGINTANAYGFYVNGKPTDIQSYLRGDIQILDYYYIGYSTGKLVCSIGYEMSKSSKRNKFDKDFLFSTLRAVQKNDEYAFIARKINQYMLSSDYIQDPLKYSTLYNYYYQIYDGKYMKQPYYADDGFVHAVDETGKEVVYDGPLGVQKIFGLEINNPTLHGVWVN